MRNIVQFYHMLFTIMLLICLAYRKRPAAVDFMLSLFLLIGGTALCFCVVGLYVCSLCAYVRLSVVLFLRYLWSGVPSNCCQ